MKLREALDIINKEVRAGSDAFTCAIATGFNPLHLVTFLAAELRKLLRDNEIKIEQGLYGDFLGNLQRLSKAEVDIGIILMEWGDLDPRLGIRCTAAWSPSTRADIVARVKVFVAQVEQTVAQTSQRIPLVLCTPTLPLLPLSHAPCWQASSFELELRSAVDSVLLRVCQLPQVRILNSQQVHSVSPLAERFDIESELRTGFPYRLPHASALANLLARLTQNARAKKGLITDLDDTLWRGLLGEVGIDGISWDLDHHSQMHAFYQRFLGCLCSEGVLVGVASKNDPALVEQAFARKDLALAATGLFPIEANWGAKSEAVSRILEVWNIAAGAVVFVDDSPLELAEVKAAHPEMECVHFPTNDDGAIYELIVSLRDRVGKSALLPEDALRAESIRRSSLAGMTNAGDGAKRTSKDFLLQTQAETILNFDLSPLDPRVLELVNKTNQFNLNGTRYTEAAWQKYFRKPGTFLLVASYTDKFGPLGKIAVVAGYQAGKRLCMDTWVMSCRAFSRQIEYRCLEELFLRFGMDEIQFNFIATERNKPFQVFLENIVGTAASVEHVLEKSAYLISRSQETEEVAL